MGGCNSWKKIVSLIQHTFNRLRTEPGGSFMKQKTYLRLGITLVLSACVILMFYDTFFQSRVLLDFFSKSSYICIDKKTKLYGSEFLKAVHLAD